jgi:hypothetical protein
MTRTKRTSEPKPERVTPAEKAILSAMNNHLRCMLVCISELMSMQQEKLERRARRSRSRGA